MKNHYKIHPQHHEDLDHNQDDTLTLPTAITDITTNSNENQSTTVTALVFKTEILDWLRSNFDDCNLSPTSTQIVSDHVTRSMKKLYVQENKDEHGCKGYVHVE
ncbi:unnamed protein product [Rotaria sordida]|uniref:Uncharacterized protein n=1 Tax=Rotaria sordida TaxID=392033 RepID=A0A815QSZ4_9BILA|nr:unnamed protein product [Rotaria sordida]